MHLPEDDDIELDDGFDDICRICARHKQLLVSVVGESDRAVKLQELIAAHLPIKVSANDELPTKICVSCVEKLDVCDQLVETCIQGDTILNKLLKDRSMPQKEDLVDEVVTQQETTFDMAHTDVTLTESTVGIFEPSNSTEPHESDTVISVDSTTTAKEPGLPVEILALPKFHFKKRKLKVMVMDDDLKDRSSDSDHSNPTNEFPEEHYNFLVVQQNVIPCPHCKFHYIEPYELTSHLLACHYGQPLLCPLCHWRFSDTANLLQHLASCQGTMVENLFYDICDSSPLANDDAQQPVENGVEPSLANKTNNSNEELSDLSFEIVEELSITKLSLQKILLKAVAENLNFGLLKYNSASDHRVMVHGKKSDCLKRLGVSIDSKEEDIKKYMEVLQTTGKRVGRVVEVECEVWFRNKLVDQKIPPTSKSVVMGVSLAENYKCNSAVTKRNILEAVALNLNMKPLKPKTVSYFREAQHELHIRYFQPVKNPDNLFECQISEFISNDVLEKHKRKDHDNYTCKYCDKIFKTHRQKNSHVRSMHGPDGEGYICTQCGSKLAGAKSMYIHMKRHESAKAVLKTCSQCFKQFRSRRSFLAHERVHNVKVCTVCGKRTNARRFLHHMQLHDTAPQLCAHCGKCFATIHRLRRHEKTHTKNYVDLDKNKTPKGKPELCPLCGYFINGCLKAHIKLHEKKTCCTRCSKMFASVSKLESHFKKAHNDQTGTCSVCGKTFRDLPMHLKNSHFAMHNNSPQLFFPCNVCKKEFDNVSDCMEHRQDHYDSQEVADCVGGDGKFICRICKKHVPTKIQLAIHREYFHQVRPFRCNCREEFWSKAALDVHAMRCVLIMARKAISKELRAPRPTPCQRCAVVCSNKYELSVHEKTGHPSACYECYLCKMKFRRQYTLDVHTYMIHDISSVFKGKTKNHPKNKLMTGEERNNTNTHYQCHICSRVCRTAMTLQWHLKRKHHDALEQTVEETIEVFSMENVEEFLSQSLKEDSDESIVRSIEEEAAVRTIDNSDPSGYFLLIDT